MRSRNVKLAGFIAVALVTAGMLAPSVVLAQDQTAGVPGDWLSRYSGARTIGMGGAFTATANDALGAVWNPAGLTFMSQNQVGFEHARLFEGTSLNAVSFVVPARSFPTLGISMISLGSGEFEATDELNQSLGSFKEGDLAVLLTASKAFSTRFSLGTNVKIVRQSVEEFHSSGVGVDLGAMYHVTPALRLGASVLNIGGPSVSLRDVSEKYPVDFRAGFAYTFFGGIAMIGADYGHRSGPGSSIHVGTEVYPIESLGLRLGYDASEPAGGFSYHVNQAMRFDYGMSNHELGVMHRFAIAYQFGGFFANSQASPAVFSPMGEQSVTKFNIKARTKSEADTWNLEIYDKHNIIVRSFGGRGVPPAHVMWDGKDDNGLTLPDGIYRYRLTVRDTEGRELVAEEKKVEITTAGPQGSVPVIVD